MKVIQFLTRSNYIIPAVLFLISFAVYQYHLSGQPWHGDEVTYLGWGGNYFNVLSHGNLSDPCLLSLDHCKHLFHIPAFGLTYSPLRNLIIGFPMYLSGHDEGNFYNWSCYWDCYNHLEGPTIQEMTSGRLLSPLFGSLTVAISFLIGKMLFNRNVGLIASLLLLFYDMWMWYSRTIMVEVHYIFFALLSCLLLLQAFKTGRIRFSYFILSGIALGVSLDFKLLAVCFSGLFLSILLFRPCQSQNKIRFGKGYIVRTIILSFSFFSIALVGMTAVEPGFYQNPLNEIRLIKSDMDNYNHDVWYIGYPSISNLQLKSTLSLFHFAIFPSFIEELISNPTVNLSNNFGWTYPPTYSSIAMTVFFFVGLGSMIYRLAKIREWTSAESMTLIWFVTALFLSLLIVKDFSLERYLLPLEISVIYISAYGFFTFLKQVKSKKAKIVLASFFIMVHSATALSFWDKTYFSPGTTWVNPLHYGTLQQSLDNPYTFWANMSFLLVIFAVTCATRGAPHLRVVWTKRTLWKLKR